MAADDAFSSDSLAVDVAQSIPAVECQTSSCNERITKTTASNSTTTKRKMTPERMRLLTDKLLEIEQVKCEERLVLEKINRLNDQRQYIQKLLNVLHLMDANRSANRSHRRQRRLQRK